MLGDAAAGDGCVYIRLAERSNRDAIAWCPAWHRRRCVEGTRGADPGGRADARPGAGRDRRARRDRPVHARRRPRSTRRHCGRHRARTRSCSSSPTSPAPRPRASPRRSSTCRTGCSRSACRRRAPPLRHRGGARRGSRPRSARASGSASARSCDGAKSSRRRSDRVRTLVRVDLAAPSAGRVRLRRLPARPGGCRARRRRRAGHAGPHAHRLGQVADVSARGDAAAGADPRALAADRADEGPGRQAATGRSRATTTFVNSSLAPEEAAARLDAVAAGRTRLLYAAPERLRQARFVETLRAIGVGLVVVDEVHCVSMWGHDFRPDYLFIRRALAELGEPVLLGLTATATPETATEIAAALGRRHGRRAHDDCAPQPPLRRRGGLERRGSAAHPARPAARRSTARPRSSTRAHVGRPRSWHACCGVTASGRSTTTRVSKPTSARGVQDDFVSGRTPVVVATTAFGMGIDKPDVRLVCLVNHPDSLESYVQMVGRAGRDGEPSDTLLLAGAARRRVRSAASRSRTCPRPPSCEPSTARCATAAGPADADALASLRPRPRPAGARRHARAGGTRAPWLRRGTADPRRAASSLGRCQRGRRPCSSSARSSWPSRAPSG